MHLEEQQEINLHTNWAARKDFIRKIGSHNGYDIVKCELIAGTCIFYIVRNDIPVGYVRCNNNNVGSVISSTYFSPHVRRKGLGTQSYKYIIQDQGVLISDWDRTQGADALWKKLSEDPTLSIQETDGVFVARLK